MNPSVTWVVRAYENKADKLIEEFILPEFKMSELSMAMGRPTSDTMYEVYRIERSHSPYFEKLLGQVLDFSSREYFLECWEE